MEYKLVSAGGRDVAGIMTLPEGQRPPHPVWFGYIAADDVDAKAAEISASGGQVHKGPADIPMVGRFAVVADPQGAVFMLFKGNGAPPPPAPPMAPGTVGWNELHAKDWQQDWNFYERLFGWSKDTAHDMGPAGTYQLFKASGPAIGGMISDAPAQPHWLYYFAVDDIDAAATRVTDHGGSVTSGPHEVPGGAWIVHTKDPQGGAFALVGLRKG
jgi:predicted enzyme related to lactoylglutathione lyase